MGKTTKADANRILSNVPFENRFWCNNGMVLNNLKEFELALKNMDDGTFKHHVNKEKNDFSNWIKDVIKDNRLADSLMKSRNKNNALKKVQSRLTLLNRLNK